MKTINKLKIENLTFKFDKNEKHFFENNSVSFDSGKLNFITGQNGAGKSTLFKILSQTKKENEFLEGFITINNKKYNLAKSREKNRQINHIKVVQQNVNSMLADKFTFNQNLKFANFGKLPSLKFLQDKNEINLIKEFNIDTETPVNLLSGGQKQILAILMALQKQTKVLLLDEPTAALDIKNSDKVISFLKQLAEKKQIIILIICHDKEIIKKYADNSFFEIKVNEKTKERILTKKEGQSFL